MALIDDVSAVDSLPIALVGTVIIIALIVALTAFGMRNVTPAVEMASVEAQVNAMANDCRFLLSLAPRQMDDPGSPPGAMRYADFDLPEGMEYLSFGFDPESGGGHEGTIYYKVSETKKAIVVDERVTFRTKEAHMILGSGRYRLSIEYARDALDGRLLLVAGAQA